MRHVLALFLSLAAVSPSAEPQSPPSGSTCVQPAGVIAGRRDLWTRSQNRYALLAYKAEKGLFDLRLCGADWRCPNQPEMEKERASIVAAAQADTAELMASGTLRGVNAIAVLNSWEVFASRFKVLTPGLKGILAPDNAAKKAMKANYSRVAGLQKELQGKVTQSEAAVGSLYADFYKARRELELVENKMRTDPEFAQRFKAGAGKLRSNFEKLQGGLQKFQDQHHNASVAAVDASRMVATYRRGQEMLGDFKPSMVRVLWALRNPPELKTFKGLSEALEGLIQYPIYYAEQGKMSAEEGKLFHDLVEKYTVQQQTHRMGRVHLETESRLLPKFVAEGQKYARWLCA